jgi:hypothetical protein
MILLSFRRGSCGVWGALRRPGLGVGGHGLGRGPGQGAWAGGLGRGPGQGAWAGDLGGGPGIDPATPAGAITSSQWNRLAELLGLRVGGVGAGVDERARLPRLVHLVGVVHERPDGVAEGDQGDEYDHAAEYGQSSSPPVPGRTPA